MKIEYDFNMDLLLWRRNNRAHPVTGKAPILLRISIKGFDRVDISTGVEAAENEWQPAGEFGRLIPPRGTAKLQQRVYEQANDQLDAVKLRVKQVYGIMCNQGHQPSPAEIKQALRPAATVGPIRLLKLCEEFYEISARPERALSPNTLANYRSRISNIRAYLDETKQSGMAAKDVSLPWGRQFARWCSDNGHGAMSVRKQVNMLQMVLDHGAHEGKLQGNALHGFRYEHKPDLAKKRKLELADITALHNATFSHDALQSTADLWLFCVYTGLSLVDYTRFAQNPDAYLQQRADGPYIHMVRQKMKHRKPQGFWVPLFPEARQILYERRRGRLPVKANSIINKQLKIICELLGLSLPDLTHKDARSTFADRKIAEGWPPPAVAAMMGDSMQVMEERYVNAGLELISREHQKRTAPPTPPVGPPLNYN